MRSGLRKLRPHLHRFYRLRAPHSLHALRSPSLRLLRPGCKHQTPPLRSVGSGVRSQGSALLVVASQGLVVADTPATLWVFCHHQTLLRSPVPSLRVWWWWPTATRPTTTTRPAILCASSCSGSKPLRSGALRSPSPYQGLIPSQRLPLPLWPSHPSPHPLPCSPLALPEGAGPRRRQNPAPRSTPGLRVLPPALRAHRCAVGATYTSPPPPPYLSPTGSAPPPQPSF